MAYRIILIEDNIDHRMMTERVLKKSGKEYDMTYAGNAEEGLRRLSQEDCNRSSRNPRTSDRSRILIDVFFVFGELC